MSDEKLESKEKNSESLIESFGFSNFTLLPFPETTWKSQIYRFFFTKKPIGEFSTYVCIFERGAERSNGARLRWVRQRTEKGSGWMCFVRGRHNRDNLSPVYVCVSQRQCRRGKERRPYPSLVTDGKPFPWCLWDTSLVCVCVCRREAKRPDFVSDSAQTFWVAITTCFAKVKKKYNIIYSKLHDPFSRSSTTPSYLLLF